MLLGSLGPGGAITLAVPKPNSTIALSVRKPNSVIPRSILRPKSVIARSGLQMAKARSSRRAFIICFFLAEGGELVLGGLVQLLLNG